MKDTPTRLDVSRLENVRHTGAKTIARCPACAEDGHDKGGDHLLIDGQGRFACVKHPGAEGVEHRKRIFALAGVTPAKKSNAKTYSTIHEAGEAVASREGGTFADSWTYTDAEGREVLAVVRVNLPGDKKTFRPFRRVADGWQSGDPAGPLPLYRLPSLAKDKGGRVFITEGEKCAAAVELLGLLATTSAHGAKSAKKSDWQPLAGRDVAIIPDNDDDGRAYAETVKAILCELDPPATVRVVNLPTLTEGEDVFDFIEKKRNVGSIANDIRFALTFLADEAKPETEAASAPINGKSLTDYAEQVIDDSKTLLGNRFLCIEGAMLFVGPSGVGKSSASVQQDVLWALGKPAFGIRPSRALRILCIQAENDEGDMTEFAKGVLDGMALTNEEREQVRKGTVYVGHKTSTGSAFVEFVGKCIAQFKPDLVRIDPLQAYLGDDPKESKALTLFTRNALNPLLERFQCALVLNHHTPKTNHRDTTKWKSSDWMYAGAGGADLTNWARAVVIIDPCESDTHLFRFIAAKRGRRIGWTGPDGHPVNERYFKHSRQAGVMLWEDAEPEDVETMTKQEKTKDDVLALVPQEAAIEKNALISKAQREGIGVNKARHFIAELEHDRKLFRHITKRQGTNPLQALARHPQHEDAT